MSGGVAMVNNPTVTVTCDKCGDEEPLEMTALACASWDMRSVDNQLKRLGWTGTTDTKTICPECQEED